MSKGRNMLVVIVVAGIANEIVVGGNHSYEGKKRGGGFFCGVELLFWPNGKNIG